MRRARGRRSWPRSEPTIVGLRHRSSTTSGARLGHGAHLDEELGGGGGPGDRGGVCAVVVGPRRRFSRGSGYGGNGGVKGGVACGSRAMRALPNLDLMEQRPDSPALEKVDGEAGASDNVMPGDDGYDSVVSVEVVRHHRLCAVLLGSSSCKRERE
jgi:hypothetical protein